MDSEPRAARERSRTHPDHPRRAVRSVAAVLTAVLAAGGVTLAGAEAASAAVAVCDASTVYVQNNTGEVRSFDVDTNTLGDVLVSGQETNGLGISKSGSTIYTLHNGAPAGASKQLAIHSSATGTITKSIGDANAPSTIIRGAVNPVDGLYYYSSTGDATGHYLGVYDPAVGTGVRVGAITGMAGTNGDFAFTSSGGLIVISDRNVYKLDAAVPTTAGNRQLSTTKIAELPAGTEGNGIAFGKNGQLFISTSTGGNRIFEVNPATGALVNTTSLGAFAPSDMASCSYPSTLSVQVDVDGRANAGDQFTVTLGGPSYVSANPGHTATTTGSAVGVQPTAAGPVFVQPNDALTLTIAPAGSTDLADYTFVPTCTDTTSGAPVSVTGNGPTWTITQPLGSNGSNVVCTVRATPAPAEADLTVTFVDEQGNPVAAPVTSTGTIGSDYSTDPKVIPGYVLVTTPANADGTYAEGGTTVTYVYAKASDVTVTYVDEQGNPLAAPVTSTGKIGSAYSTDPKQIPGYVLVTTPANADGTYANGATTVTYVYAKASDLTVTYVDEQGNPLAAPVTSTGKIGSDYSTDPKVIPGYALVETPANADGEYVEGGTTVTYVYAKVSDLTVTYVDEQGNPLAAPVTSTGKVGSEYSTDPKQIPGYVVVTTPANADGTYADGGTTVTYVYAKASDLTVTYVDEQGNPLAAPVTSTGKIGSDYSTDPKQIPGYVVVTTPANADGTYADGATTVTYVYAKASDVTATYVDEQGNPIAAPVTSTGKIGSDYSTDPKQIPGYVLVTTPANADGTYANGATTVTYVYAKASDLTVTYVDEQGNPLAAPVTSTGKIGSDYSTDPAQIPGYVLVATPANADGTYANGATTVTYVYAKASDLTVTYVDEQGNPLAAPVTSTGKIGSEYSTDPKQIPGYVLVTTPANADGTYAADATTTVTYVYAKASDVTVTFVDEQGNPLSASVTSTGKIGSAYATDPKVIPGYVLVATPANADGTYADGSTTVIYVYKKVAAAAAAPAAAGPSVNTGGAGVAGPDDISGWTAISAGILLVLAAGAAFARRRRVQ